MWNRVTYLNEINDSLKIFDFEDGSLLDTYYNIHEQTITCIAFYEACEYLITGAKDGIIKVWNARKLLMFDFHEHLNSITGLLLLENVCEAPRGSLPLLVSASTDCSIRMFIPSKIRWNFETGQSLYRLDVSEVCLGIGFLKKVYNCNRLEPLLSFWVNKYFNLQAIENRYLECE
jgi:WD40 repeat protein